MVPTRRKKGEAVKIDYDDCTCTRCSPPADRRPVLMMFVAFVLLWAVIACIKIHDRSSIWIKAHRSEVRP